MPGSRFWVCALNVLQNSMMLRPRWPRAGPIGGDGLALPAGTCSLIIPTIFFAISYSLVPLARAARNGTAGILPACRLEAGGPVLRPRATRSNLLDLRIFQFDRGRPAED